MKNTTKLIATGFAAFTLAGAAYSQTTVVNITGATAFRAAANTSIIALLGGAGTTEYTFDTTTGASAGATNRAIYRGSVAGIPGTVIVRASWSGSTAGIAAVAAGTPVQVLKTTTAMSTAGTGFAAVAGDFETSPASFAFSDVAQAASTTLSPTLNGTAVGVVPAPPCSAKLSTASSAPSSSSKTIRQPSTMDPVPSTASTSSATMATAAIASSPT